MAHFDDQNHAADMWKKFGRGTDRRRALERDVARYAEITSPWRVALWISPDRMRLKPALVLVDDDDKVRTMLARERSRGSRRGVDIYEAHRRLWSVEVLVHRGFAAEIPWIQARFAEGLEINAWSDPTLPADTATVACEEVGDRLRLTRQEKRTLAESIPAFLEGSAQPGGSTRGGLLDQLEQAASARGLGIGIGVQDASRPASSEELDKPAASPGPADGQQEFKL